jgi:tRNA A-37 threonylcarbamoyl transferase component Bud32
MPNLPQPADCADAALTSAAAAALAASTARIVVVEHLGVRYVAKRPAERPRRLSQALVLRWLVKRITGQTLPMRTMLLSDAASSLDYEARRLASLARAGERVPRVVHQEAGYLLMEHCGETVATLLERWPIDLARAEMEQLAAQLGAFHRAGHWHGAAQIKNLTRRDGHTYRIDFEEDFGEFGPLAATQALDLVLFLNSVSLAGPISEAESRELLLRLLAAYFAANPDPQVRAVMRRGMPWGAALARLASPFRGLKSGGRPRKGAARVVILADALAAALRTP